MPDSFFVDMPIITTRFLAIFANHFKITMAMRNNLNCFRYILLLTLR